MMEHVCGPLAEKRITLFSDNSPTVSWVQRIACHSSLVAKQLIRVLALRFNLQKFCLITTLHIAGDQNSMTDIPSRSFGSEHKWNFKSDHDFSLGSRVCTSILTLQFWHHTNYHSILVTYPPHAVTLPSLTNLGPVVRLEHAES